MSDEKSSSDTARPGTSIADPSERLPSLKPKRDLTLGGVKKRVFTPTVPPRRKKQQEDEVTGASSGPSDSGSQSVPGSSKNHGGKKNKGGERRKQDRGPRRKREVITGSSVFSMGPAERMMQSRREMVTFGHVSSSVQSERGTAKLEGEKDEPKVIDNLLDESMEDVQPSAAEDVFLDSVLPPIKLPLDYTMHNNKQSSVLLTTPTAPRSNIKVKKEASFEEMEVDPVIISNTSTSNRGDQLTVSELFTPSEDERGVFLLFQFPNCLPVPNSKTSEKTAMETSSTTDKQEKEENKEGISNSSLRDVPEGVVGKIRVHKSGDVKLVLGDNILNVTMGTRGGFLQELSSIKVSEPPSCTVLGHLSHRLVCVPDLLSMTKDDR